MRKRFFPLMAFLISLAAVLVVGEALCRLKLYLGSRNSAYLTAPFGKFKKPQVEYQFNIEDFNVNVENSYYFKLKPGTYQPPEPYDYGFFTINSHGFRGKEFSLFNKAQKTRIFCIGESSTFGAESPDGETWPAKLESYLNKDGGDKFDVINGGFPGAASSTYKNLIRLELVNYKPDIFLIYAGANELILDRMIQNRHKRGFMDYLNSALYYKSMLYTLLIEKTSALITKSPAPMNVYSNDPEKVFIDNIKEIIKVCRERQIKLYFVRQMYLSSMDLFMKNDPSLEEIKTSLKDAQKGGWITEDKIYGFNKIIASQIKLSSEYNIPLMDFRKEFYSRLLKNEQLYYDYIHLTPEGNDALARLISQEISDGNALKNR